MIIKNNVILDVPRICYHFRFGTHDHQGYATIINVYGSTSFMICHSRPRESVTMPLPQGAHYEKGSLGKFVILKDGTRVKKAAAFNLGAKKLGFHSDYQYRKFLKRVKKSNKLHTVRRKRFEKKLKNEGMKKGEIRQRLYEFDQQEAKFFKMKLEGQQLDYSNEGEATEHMISCGFRRDANDNWVSDEIL